jgi:hypothetical protein
VHQSELPFTESPRPHRYAIDVRVRTEPRTVSSSPTAGHTTVAGTDQFTGKAYRYSRHTSKARCMRKQTRISLPNIGADERPNSALVAQCAESSNFASSYCMYTQALEHIIQHRVHRSPLAALHTTVRCTRIRMGVSELVAVMPGSKRSRSSSCCKAICAITTRARFRHHAAQGRHEGA